MAGHSGTGSVWTDAPSSRQIPGEELLYHVGRTPCLTRAGTASARLPKASDPRTRRQEPRVLPEGLWCAQALTTVLPVGPPRHPTTWSWLSSGSRGRAGRLQACVRASVHACARWTAHLSACSWPRGPASCPLTERLALLRVFEALYPTGRALGLGHEQLGG